MHPVAVFGALVVVATTTAAGDGREEDGTKRLTPAEIQQVRASLERIRREVDRMEMEQESRDEELKRMAATWDFMTKKLPLPEVVARPETPTIKFAIPRGLAWLAAVQQVDGSWNTSLEANGLATLAYFPGPFDAEEPRIAQLRIRVFGGQVASASPTAPKDISWVLLSRCAVDAPPAELESLARRLASMRKKSGAWASERGVGGYDALATSWAAIALHTATEALGPETTRGARPVSAMTFALPEKPKVAELAAVLLCTRLAYDAVDDADDPPPMTRVARILATSRPSSLEEWYLGGIALKSVRSRHWPDWKKAMVDVVLHAQRSDGSWNDGASHDLKARIRGTALALLCLRLADS